jgi:hypothetical protein
VILAAVGFSAVLSIQKLHLQGEISMNYKVSCAALLLLAQEVHRKGFKVTLTGEGADEWLAGYPWYKVNRLLNFFDVIPGLPLSRVMRRGLLALTGATKECVDYIKRIHQTLGHHSSFQEIYGIMSLSRQRFFSPRLALRRPPSIFMPWVRANFLADCLSLQTP